MKMSNSKAEQTMKEKKEEAKQAKSNISFAFKKENEGRKRNDFVCFV